MQFQAHSIDCRMAFVSGHSQFALHAELLLHRFLLGLEFSIRSCNSRQMGAAIGAARTHAVQLPVRPPWVCSQECYSRPWLLTSMFFGPIAVATYFHSNWACMAAAALVGLGALAAAHFTTQVPRMPLGSHVPPATCLSCTLPDLHDCEPMHSGLSSALLCVVRCTCSEYLLGSFFGQLMSTRLGGQTWEIFLFGRAWKRTSRRTGRVG